MSIDNFRARSSETVGSNPEINCASNYKFDLQNVTEKEIKFYTTDREVGKEKPITTEVKNNTHNKFNVIF
jgi:hypothetical protein